jgi:hypothetical protein
MNGVEGEVVTVFKTRKQSATPKIVDTGVTKSSHQNLNTQYIIHCILDLALGGIKRHPLSLPLPNESNIPSSTLHPQTKVSMKRMTKGQRTKIPPPKYPKAIRSTTSPPCAMQEAMEDSQILEPETSQQGKYERRRGTKGRAALISNF